MNSEEAPIAEAVATLSGGDDSTLLFWLKLLEELEADLAGIEGLLGHEVGETASGVGAWRVPQSCPPIPEALIPRARLVLEKQLAAAHDVARRISATEAEMALMDKVRDTTLTHTPVYLDTQA